MGGMSTIRPRWRLETHSDFTTPESNRLYKSFVWSLWALVFLIPIVLLGPLLAGEQVSIFTSPYVLTQLLPGVAILATVYARWLSKGFDLRTTRNRIEAALLFLVPAIGAVVAFQTGDLLHRTQSAGVAVSLAITALLLVTYSGPKRVVVPVALVSAGLTALIPNVIGLQILSVAFIAALFWLSLKMSEWYVVVIGDLEKARQTEADLAVARERLRFSADLHDVMGRNLSAISLKAQLASELMARGDDKAQVQLQEVSELASSSLAEVRSLVRGYQKPNLEVELDGAVSLLRASGARVTISGSPKDLNPAAATHTASLIREATTNIIKHSSAKDVSISMSAKQVQIINDGASGGPNETGGTGLAGLGRRIGDDGVISYDHEGDRFRLTLTFQEPS